jgi:geranylgeranyl pyrophosphate synthase
VNAVPAAPDPTGYLTALRAIIEPALARAIAAAGAPPLVLDAMRYALLGGGKRLRPCLTLAAAECAGAAAGLPPARAYDLALPGACAVEMVHTYSLVHDDLPAMDDDALRRGRATTHVVYGEGLAILAGDALLTEAFAVLAESPSRASAPGAPAAEAGCRLEAVRVLAAAAGAAGMVGGQAIDLAGAGRVAGPPPPAFTPAALEDMHRRKTGALIRAAAGLGAILAGAGAPIVAAIDAYARDLGLAFQIVDDILDVEGSADALGKTAGKDAAAGKPTYPALFGIDVSRRLAREAIERARAALRSAGLSGRLEDIAEWSEGRRS